MDSGRQFIRKCSDYAVRLKPASVRFLPGVPHSGKRERSIILHPECVGLLRLLIYAQPLIKTVCRDEAPALLERPAKSRARFDGLGLGIDGGDALHVGKLFRKEGHKTAAHKHQLTLTRLLGA